MDKLEPQQPEGELALCPQIECVNNPLHPFYKDGVACKNCIGRDFLKAQRAFDLATMVPSEDELALWLCDHLSYTSRGLAQVLLERLLGEKP